MTPKPKAEEILTEREKAIMNEAFMVGRVYANMGEKEMPAEIHQKLHANCLRAASAHCRTLAKDEGEKDWITEATQLCENCEEMKGDTICPGRVVKDPKFCSGFKPTAPADEGEELAADILKVDNFCRSNNIDIEAVIAELAPNFAGKKITNLQAAVAQESIKYDDVLQSMKSCDESAKRLLAEKDKQIKELEEREYLIVHGQSGGKTAAVQLFEARAKLKSAEAVVEAWKEWNPMSRQVAQAIDGLRIALSAHDKEPEEKHYIEEGS